MLINLPTFSVLVDNAVITGGAHSGYSEAYLVGARCIKSRPILFTVHLDNGALYAGLPINALYGLDSSKTHKLAVHEAQPWSCLEAPANALTLTHLKDYEVHVQSPAYKDLGRYLFTIDYSGEGLAQDPVQHKSHNIIATEHGPLVAMPNNYCLFADMYSTTEHSLPLSALKRQTNYLLTY
jgi:hypothetical protein